MDTECYCFFVEAQRWDRDFSKVNIELFLTNQIAEILYVIDKQI